MMLVLISYHQHRRYHLDPNVQGSICQISPRQPKNIEVGIVLALVDILLLYELL